MSLNWNASNTPAYAAIAEEQGIEDGTYTEAQRSTLDMLIWGSLLLDLPGIRTEADADEFIFRARFANACGVWAYSEVPTRFDLDEWVGLTTNVSRKTRHQYIQKVGKQVREDIERRMASEKSNA